MDWIRQGLEPLTLLPLNSWVLLAGSVIALAATFKLALLVFNFLATGAGSKRMVGTHASLAENEAFMFRGDMKDMGLNDRSAITIKNEETGAQVRVLLREFGQQRSDTPMGHPKGIAFHKRQLATLLDAADEDDLPKEPTPMRIKQSGVANLFAHPDESIRITTWVTLAVTMLTSVFSVVVEIVIP